MNTADLKPVSGLIAGTIAGLLLLASTGPYLESRVLQGPGSAVSDGEVVHKRRYLIDRATRADLRHWEVGYRFRAEGMARAGVYRCSCPELSPLLEGDPIQVRFLVEDPGRNRPALLDRDVGVLRIMLIAGAVLLGAGVLLIASALREARARATAG